MPLPSSGQISVSDINTELGRTSNTANSNFAGGSTPQSGSLFKLGEAGGVNQTAPHAMSEWYNFSSAADLGFTIGEKSLGNTSPPTSHVDWRIGYVNSTLNLNSTSYTAGGVSSHGSLTNTTPSQLDGNTITAVGVRYRADIFGWRANIDIDGDGYIDNYFQEVYLYVKGTSSPISTWSSLTFTGDATSGGSGYVYYVDSSAPKSLYIKIADSQPNPSVGSTITGSGVPSGTKITGVSNLDGQVFTDPDRWLIQVDKNCTPTVNNTYSYTGLSTQTNTYSRISATLTTGTFAYGGGSNTDGFLLYRWTSNLGSVDDGGISLAKYFQSGSTSGTEITIS
jgi:hypothetical protein